MQKGSGGLPFRRSPNKNNLRLTDMCCSRVCSKKTVAQMDEPDKPFPFFQPSVGYSRMDACSEIYKLNS